MFKKRFTIKNTVVDKLSAFKNNLTSQNKRVNPAGIPPKPRTGKIITVTPITSNQVNVNQQNQPAAPLTRDELLANFLQE